MMSHDKYVLSAKLFDCPKKSANVVICGLLSPWFLLHYHVKKNFVLGVCYSLTTYFILILVVPILPQPPKGSCYFCLAMFV